jgi:hypothetical protein
VHARAKKNAARLESGGIFRSGAAFSLSSLGAISIFTKDIALIVKFQSHV